jgi:membrane protease YdiL (CAAX protease family)
MTETSNAISPRARRRALVFLVLAAAILWFPVVPLLAGRPPGFLRDLGFVSGPGGTALAWGLAVVVAVVYATLTVQAIPLVARYWCTLSPAKGLAIVAAFAAAIVEEAFFRRLLMDWLRTLGMPAVGQILLSGLMFGLAHGIWGIASGQPAMGIRVMMATGMLGTALAVVYVVGGRSLAPPIVAHFVITATIQPGITFAAFSGGMARPEHGWWRLTRP